MKDKEQTMKDWLTEIKMAVTICDTKGIIVYMNDQSVATFQKSGEKSLIGSTLFDCHPAKAKEKILALMENNSSNVYTIEKKGKKKIIYQTPWVVEGKLAGLVECSFEIPLQMPHFKRDSLAE